MRRLRVAIFIGNTPKWTKGHRSDKVSDVIAGRLPA
jgi:hypothetical protein